MTTGAVRNVLAIAGSDPSGGAGIQADLKTFAALGVYGGAVVTALTAQNTRGVTGVHHVPATFVEQQITAVLSDVEVSAVKTGMLGTAGCVRAVARSLRSHPVPIVVIDPVIAASAGGRLLDDEGVEAMRAELLPIATVVTPNAAEAGMLLGTAELRTVAEARDAARALHAFGVRNVLVTGGHLESARSVDVLYDGVEWHEFATPRVAGKGNHGTGCTLASALTALLARGVELQRACAEAQQFVAASIAASGRLGVGHGNGPVHQLHALWERLASAP